MTDIPYVLTTTDMLMLRLGQASYGDQPTRMTALALGSLASPADAMGTCATVVIEPETVNQTANVLAREPVTMGQTLRALDALVAMEFIHETARTIGPWRVHLLDTSRLVPRIDPVLDCCGPEPDYGHGVESDTYGYGEQAA